jgi:two-component system sensor histidine kinase/response regulator
VIYATDPSEGIRIARTEPPDLILLDILMPKMEGSQVAEVLLTDPRTKQIPLLFLTAVVTEAEIGLKAIKKIGGQNFIAKPVDTKRLISCIKAVTEEKARV